MQISDRIPLADGNAIPIMVFGSRPDSFHQALDLGWRAFDTAQEYGNEQAVGEAIRSYPAFADGSLKRSDIWVTTKVAGQETNPDADWLGTIKASVEKVGLGYIDLFILHKPFGTADGRRKQWLALVEAKKLGLVKSIGVSNFGPKHLEELKGYSSERPVVNQLEVHPFNQEPELQAYCKREKIQIQPYSPACRTQKMDDPQLQKIAKESGRSWNQVMLRWSLQKGFNPISGSRRPEGNAEVRQIFDFELTDDQKATLNGLDEKYRCCPENVLDVDVQPAYHYDGKKVTLL